MNENTTTKPAIELWDVKQLIVAKIPTLSKYIPAFVYKYIRRKMHEDEINMALVNYQHLTNFVWIDAILDFLNITVQVHGEQRIPKHGKHTFVGNHPSGSNDGIAYFSIIGRHFPMVKSVSNAFLDFFPNIRDLYVPVNMLGNQNKNSLQAIDTLYSSDSQVLHFPSGIVSRRFDGVIRDIEWKKSYITKSIQHNRTIIPAYLEARNSDFFYRLSSLRRKIGLKQPFELFFLVDEMFKNRGTTIKFTFGSPITPQELSKDRRHSEWALLIRQYVYSLKDEPDRSFKSFMEDMDKKKAAE